MPEQVVGPHDTPRRLIGESFCALEKPLQWQKGYHMVLFQEFPWELPGVQAYQIFGVQSTVMNERWSRLSKGS